MIINFYDVEHGSCTHIITPNGKHILVDIGSKTDKSIVNYLRYNYLNLPNEQIDELIITHPHEDHIYDIAQLYNLLKPKVLQRPKEAFDIVPLINTPKHKEISDFANKMNAEYNCTVQENLSPTNNYYNGGVDFSIISPKLSWTTKEDLNTFSSIIIVKYCGYKFVLTGDNPKWILQKMIDENYSSIRNEVYNATILLAPHHGRVNEYCDDFFKLVNPYLTVVSDKSIVHTTQEETAKLYKGRGVNLYGTERYVLTTRNDGTINMDVSPNYCGVSMDKECY